MNYAYLEKAPFYFTQQTVRQLEKQLVSMTIEEKIAQLFCLILYDNHEAAVQNILRLAPGGVMLRPMPAKTAVGIVQTLQSQSTIPMLIAANLEKGGNGVACEGTLFHSPLGVAATENSRFAQALGDICGKEGAACGVNWAFAPIVDIDYNFRNPITNTRTFGADPKTVAEMGAQYIQALQNHPLAACAKHFPGDGRDERDQHLVTAVNDLSVEDWYSSYGQVYRAAIDADVLTVMVGHFLFPAYERSNNPALQDGDILPASLSPAVVGKLLREELGFNGLVVTDSTTMGGFLCAMPRAQAVPQTIAAGCDMFLFSYNLDEDFAYMRKGYQDGVITPQRLDQAVSRILALKWKLGLFNERSLPELEATYRIIGTELSKKVARECQDRSITLVKEQPGVLPITPARYPRVLLHGIEPTDEGLYGNRTDATAKLEELLCREGFAVERFAPLPQTEGSLPPQQQSVAGYDLILYAANLATKSNQTTVRIEWMPPMGANLPIFQHSVPTVFVSLENPYHLLDVPRIKTYINTYNASDSALEMLVEKLAGRSQFYGVSPVDPFCGKWDTRL